MEASKVVINNEVKIDLTEDTVTASDVLSGTSFHLPSGTKTTGTLVVQNYYTGSSEPSASLGNDGDLYFKVSS